MWNAVQNLYQERRKYFSIMEQKERGIDDFYYKNPNSIIGRTSKLYNNEEFSDVKFLVIEIKELLEKTFFAHRLILSISSPVFASMFYGTKALTEKVISIHDVTIEAFSNLLMYIYADRIDFRTMSNLFETLYAARKYKLNNLEEKCLKILNAIEIPPEGACEAYELAIQHEVWDVASACQRIFEFETRSVLNSSGFLSSGVTTVATILRKDYLEVESESELFDAVVKWGKAECRRRITNDKITPADIRKCISCFLPFIRFLTLTPLEIARVMERHKIFTPKEGSFILLKLKKRDLNITGVSDKFSKSEDKRISRYHKCLLSTTCNGLKYRSNPPLISQKIMDISLRVTGNRVRLFGIGVIMGNLPKCSGLQCIEGSLNFSVEIKNSSSTEVAFQRERVITDNKCEWKFYPSLEMSESQSLYFEVKSNPNMIKELVNAENNFFRYQKHKTNSGDAEIYAKLFFCPIVSEIELLFENSELSDIEESN